MALDLDKYSVLIVDDVREMRTSLRTIARSMGAQEVYEAKSGLEAIELLQAHNMDIVLCDYNLGEGRDGQQVFEEAKEHGILNHRHDHVHGVISRDHDERSLWREHSVFLCFFKNLLSVATFP